jgi:phosphomannomutase
MTVERLQEDFVLQIKFGTDGWRGIIARDFTFDNLALVAQATMDYFVAEGLADKGLVVGYDRRFLSRKFAERVVEIAAGNNLKVYLTDDYAPTPAVSWAVRRLGAAGGIMITASHNPPEYNGFKIKESFGGSARPATTKVVEEIVAKNAASKRKILEMPLAEAFAQGQAELIDAKQAYFAQLAEYVDLELIKKAGIPVIADPMFGAGSGCLPWLLPGTDEIHGS